jgi:crossover junction endodeoxyribonuclease RusA
MIILLPFPPSVNSYWNQVVMKTKSGKSFRSTALTKRAKEFKKAALITIKKQYPIHTIIDFPVKVFIQLFPPTLRKYDVDNFNKGILDALTHANIWTDDDLVHDLRIIKKEKVKYGAVIVKIERL